MIITTNDNDNNNNNDNYDNNDYDNNDTINMIADVHFSVEICLFKGNTRNDNHQL